MTERNEEVTAEREPTYRITEWSGLPNYECLLCPFAVLDLDTLHDHQFMVHATATVAPKQEPVAEEEPVEPEKSEAAASAKATTKRGAH